MDTSMMEAETRTSSFLGSVAFAEGADDARSGSGRFSVLQEPTAIQLPVLYEADLPAQDGHAACEGAQTLRLVQQAVKSMQDLQERADLISARALDLIHVTHQERAQLQADLQGAREAAMAWETQARAAEVALRDATVQIREAELTRRELEVRARQATGRAEAAEARVKGLEHYLKEIRAFLEARMTGLRR